MATEPQTLFTEAAVPPAPTPTPPAPPAPEPQFQAPPPPAASQTPPTAPVPTAAPSVRDQLKNIGLEQFAGRFQDDDAALRALAYQAQEAERLREYARYGKEVLPHLETFRKWQAEQEQAQKAAAAEKARWWNPPEYDPRWAQLIEQDPQTGELKPRQGAPLNVVEKYRTALEHSRGFLEKFAFDPVGSIRPGIEEVARELVTKTVQEQVQVMREQLLAKDMLQRNAAWMYAPDPATGQQQWTPYGQVYAQTVANLEQRGVRDISMQDEIARDKAIIAMQADHLKHLQAQASATPQIVNPPVVPAPTPDAAQAAANADFTRRRGGGRKPSQNNPATTTDTPIPPGRSSLREAILADLEQNGIHRNGKLIAN